MVIDFTQSRRESAKTPSQLVFLRGFAAAGLATLREIFFAPFVCRGQKLVGAAWFTGDSI